MLYEFATRKPRNDEKFYLIGSVDVNLSSIRNPNVVKEILFVRNDGVLCDFDDVVEMLHKNTVKGVSYDIAREYHTPTFYDKNGDECYGIHYKLDPKHIGNNLKVYLLGWCGENMYIQTQYNLNATVKNLVSFFNKRYSRKGELPELETCTREYIKKVFGDLYRENSFGNLPMVDEDYCFFTRVDIDNLHPYKHNLVCRNSELVCEETLDTPKGEITCITKYKTTDNGYFRSNTYFKIDSKRLPKNSKLLKTRAIRKHLAYIKSCGDFCDIFLGGKNTLTRFLYDTYTQKPRYETVFSAGTTDKDGRKITLRYLKVKSTK